MIPGLGCGTRDPAAMIATLPLITAALSGPLMPPVARRVPHTVTFGAVTDENRGQKPMDPPLTRDDDLFWLRDDTRKNEEILTILRDENAYTADRTGHLDAFRTGLYDEMLSHVQEDDDTDPYPAADGYEYWRRTLKGLSFGEHWRRVSGGPDELVLDVNAVAKTLPNPAQCDVGEVACSPSGKQLAYAVDGSGYETYDIRIGAVGGDVEETLTDTGGSIAWASEGALFYVKQDAAHRPYQVWLHTLGMAQADDRLIFEELDELYNVACWRSRDGSLVFIEAESKETSELRLVPTATPDAPPALVREREFGVRYDIDSHAPSSSLLITSNVDGLRNRQLYVASLAAPSEWALLVDAAGEPVLPHSAERSLDGLAAFDGFVAVSGREGGFTQVWTAPLASTAALTASAAAHRIAFEADSFESHIATNRLFAPSGKLRLSYTSMTSPLSSLEYDIATRQLTTRKVVAVPGYDASLYATRRVLCPSRDGTAEIPITLLWRKDMCETADGELAASPLHLYGYGS